MRTVDYDERACELDVTFTSGKVYRYFDVPVDVYVDLLDAASKGEFFNDEIKDTYNYVEVTQRRRRT